MACSAALRAGIAVSFIGAVGGMTGCGSASTTSVNAQSNIDPGKKAALDKALAAGVLTKDEYNAKLQALAAAAPPAGGSQAAAQSKGRPAGDWKVVTVDDPMFNMPAYKIQIPADWKFVGAVVRTSCEGAMLVFRAESPDGLTGVQTMPNVRWVYSQNNQALQQANRTCGVHAPVPAATQAPQIAAAARPQPQLDPVQPWEVPGYADMYAKDNALYESTAQARGMPAAHESGDAARIHLHYNYQGHAVEEVLTVSTTVTDAPVAISGVGANGIIQPGWGRTQTTATYVTGNRAPQGKLDAAMPLLSGIKLAIVPEYDQAVLAFNAQQFQQVMSLSKSMFQNTLRQGQISEQTLMANHQAYMRWQQSDYAQHNRQFVEQMQMKDSNNKNFVDYVSNQTYYMNPETGEDGCSYSRSPIDSNSGDSL